MFAGKAIQAARIVAGLKGKELARRVGVTNVTISRIENGRQRPSQNLAERIARALGVNVETFYCEEDRSGGVLAMPDLSSEEREILERFRRLSSIGRAKVWAFVMGLASSGSSEGAEAASELIEAGKKALQTSEAQANKQARRA